MTRQYSEFLVPAAASRRGSSARGPRQAPPLPVRLGSARGASRRHGRVPRRGGDRGLRVRRGDQDLQLPVPLRGPIPHHAGGPGERGGRGHLPQLLPDPARHLR